MGNERGIPDGLSCHVEGHVQHCYWTCNNCLRPRHPHDYGMDDAAAMHAAGEHTKTTGHRTSVVMDTTFVRGIRRPSVGVNEWGARAHD